MDLKFNESDIDLIKSIRKQINLSNLERSKNLPEGVKKGFAILKKDSKVYYVPFSSDYYGLLKKSASNSKHLCNNCKLAYANKCPKVAAPNSTYGKCIENFDFIKDGIEIVAGIEFCTKSQNRPREFFAVTNCSNNC